MEPQNSWNAAGKIYQLLTVDLSLILQKRKLFKFASISLTGTSNQSAKQKFEVSKYI